MTLNAKTLRPGFLVSMKTTLRGNVSYNKRDIDSGITAEGVAVAKWETERTISDAAEHERGVKARNKACSVVRSVCAVSAFGLLCPEPDRDMLAKAIADARKIADEFNASASLSRISFAVLIGRVAADDVEAVKAINAEIRELLSEMEAGVRNLEPAKIRDAATKAREIGQMLTPDAAARINVAIEAARKTARDIVAAGTAAAQEIDSRTLRTLAESRTAFLDFDATATDVAIPEAESRALDFEPAADVSSPIAATVAPDFDEYGPVVAQASESVALELNAA